MNSGLLIIDIQNDYFPGGKMELEGSSEAGLRAAGLISSYRSLNLPVIHIQHISTRPDAPFFIPGTEGVEINSIVAPAACEPIVQKHFPNSFRNTHLLDLLKKMKIEHIVIAGMMTHMCVDATTRAAFDYGFQCTVIGDACATRALTFGAETVPAKLVHAAFLAALNGIYAQVISAGDFLR